MDEFDQSVGTAREGGSSSKAGLVGVLVGVVGVIVGITGIVLANNAQQAVKTLEAKVAAQADLTKTVDDLNGRLEKLGTEFVKLDRQDKQLQASTQAAFNEVGKTIEDNRQAINQLTERLGQAAKAPARASSGGSDAAAEAAPADGVYTVQAGDTLMKIASKYGVSLEKLQAANPNVDSRRMQIGQKINIPKP